MTLNTSLQFPTLPLSTETSLSLSILPSPSLRRNGVLKPFSLLLASKPRQGSLRTTALLWGPPTAGYLCTWGWLHTLTMVMTAPWPSRPGKTPIVASAWQPSDANLSSPAMPPSANKSHPHLPRHLTRLTHVQPPAASAQRGDAPCALSWCPCEWRKGCSSTRSQARCVHHARQDSSREQPAGKETAPWWGRSTLGPPNWERDVLQPSGSSGCQPCGRAAVHHKKRSCKWRASFWSSHDQNAVGVSFI